jgi:hypothetical protein
MISSNPRPSQEGYHAKLEKLVSTTEQGRPRLNSEAGTLTTHFQSRHLQINAREDIQRRRKKLLDMVNQIYYRKKPLDAQEFAGNRITDFWSTISNGFQFCGPRPLDSATIDKMFCLARESASVAKHPEADFPAFN